MYYIFKEKSVTKVSFPRESIKIYPQLNTYRNWGKKEPKKNRV